MPTPRGFMAVFGPFFEKPVPRGAEPLVDWPAVAWQAANPPGRG